MKRLMMGGCVALLALVSSLAAAKPAAAWGAADGNASTTMAMASMAHTFVPVSAGVLVGVNSGVGGDGYRSVFTGIGTTVYFDIRSDSSIPLDFRGSVSIERGTGVTLFPQVRIYACSVPWNSALGTCSGTMTLRDGPFRSASSASFTWARLEPGKSIYMAVTTGVEVGSMRVSASAVATPTRSAMDRTAG